MEGCITYEGDIYAGCSYPDPPVCVQPAPASVAPVELAGNLADMLAILGEDDCRSDVPARSPAAAAPERREGRRPRSRQGQGARPGHCP
ncbi:MULTISPECIES: hypothetical protein [unclassified Streptomyces]|uniref:hypothetical protein n=1 Tax=unclassified Streptomyces TaxID=2593676 RepID=UPI0035E018CF